MIAIPEPGLDLYGDLHALARRLTRAQVRHVRPVLRDAVGPDAQPYALAEGDRAGRMRFVGIMNSGVGDLGERSEDYLAEGFGRDHRSAD